MLSQMSKVSLSINRAAAISIHEKWSFEKSSDAQQELVRSKWGSKGMERPTVQVVPGNWAQNSRVSSICVYGEEVMLTSYVDDLIVFANSECVIDRIKQELRKNCRIKTLS